MRPFFAAFLLLLCFYTFPTTLLGQSSNSNKKGKLVTTQDSLFYAFGYSTIEGPGVEGLEWNAKQFAKGVKDKLKGKSKITDEAALALLKNFGQTLQARQGEAVTKENPFVEDMDSVSYCFGSFFTGELNKIEVPIAKKAWLAGFQDGISGKNELGDEGTLRSCVSRFNQLANEKARAIQEAEAEKAAKENKEAALSFLAENQTQPDVITLESGLQYKVLESGDAAGESPTVQDKVIIHYEGRLLDGTVFDSSFERGERATFPLGNLIQGWQIALPLMKPGDKWTLWIPAELAYGDAGSPPTIPAGALLVFDIAYFGIAE